MKRALLFALLLGFMTSCNSTDGNQNVAEMTVGPEGGTLVAECGVVLEFPAGAVASDTNISVTVKTGVLPTGYTAVTDVFVFEPDGITFEKGVTVKLPLDGAQAQDPLVFWTLPGTEEGFVQLPGSAVDGGFAVAVVDHFSLGFAGSESECVPGDARCLGQWAQVCSENGTWNQEPVDCTLDEKCCYDGLCIEKKYCDAPPIGEPECTQGQTSCLETQWVRTCDASGHWKKTTNCFAQGNGYECSGGKCIGPEQECANGAVQCSGTLAMKCSAALTWEVSEDCAAKQLQCVGGECVDEGPCVEGNKRCVGDDVMVCNEKQIWEASIDCTLQGKVCIEGACLCEPQKTYCVGTVKHECINGDWSPEEDCADDNKVCSNGVCVDPNCSDVGATRCVANGIEECSEDGVWVFKKECEEVYEQCIDGGCIPKCEPGDIICVGNDIQECVEQNDIWTWVTVEVCDAEVTVCIDGACHPAPVCDPGLKICDGSMVKECDTYGQWQDVEDCSIQLLACQSGACVMGGVWLDQETGLFWQANPPHTTMITLDEANAYCETLDLFGMEWRMPDIDELRSLLRLCPGTLPGGPCPVAIQQCVTSSCITQDCIGCKLKDYPDADCFWPEDLTGKCGWYWSTTEVQGAEDPSKFAIMFSNALVSSVYNVDLSFVRCVYNPNGP